MRNVDIVVLLLLRLCVRKNGQNFASSKGFCVSTVRRFVTKCVAQEY